MTTEVGHEDGTYVPVFEEPPPPRLRRRKSLVFTDEVVAALKAAPTKWIVLIPEAATKDVTNAQNWAKRRPGFVVTSRTVAEDRLTHPSPYRVYAMYDPARVAKERAELSLRDAKREAKKASVKTAMFKEPV